MIEEPILKFDEWFTEAKKLKGRLAEIATLATVDSLGQPSARMINFKGFRQGGLSFFSNYLSQKGAALSVNPKACMIFYWPEIRRQIRLEGECERLSADQSDDYFYSRDHSSQVTAFLSRQSEVLPNVERFLDDCESLDRAGNRIDRPAYWGGFCLVPERIEFWESRPARRHKRLQYRRTAVGWNSCHLYP